MQIEYSFKNIICHFKNWQLNSDGDMLNCAYSLFKQPGLVSLVCLGLLISAFGDSSVGEWERIFLSSSLDKDSVLTDDRCKSLVLRISSVWEPGFCTRRTKRKQSCP